MDRQNLKRKAIACMSGGYKTVFTHGVLTAFEQNKFYADAYGGCSSSALISAYAAMEKISLLDLSLWVDSLNISKLEGNSQSNAILHSIDIMSPLIENYFKMPNIRRLLIATSFVKTSEAADLTQSDKARRWGQKLLIEASKNITTWRDANLDLHIFDTHSEDGDKQLTEKNFNEVAYASTRMLHEWHIPAFIDGKAYIDGSYTCLYPVIPLLNLGYDKIICILTEHDNKRVDMFSKEENSPIIKQAKIDYILPEINLKEMGVDYYSATEDSLKEVYLYGYKKGVNYIDALS
jgi:predicted acylesterase/phospholipase RssA